MYQATIFTFKVSSIFSVLLGKDKESRRFKNNVRKKFFGDIFTFSNCSCNATLICKRSYCYLPLNRRVGCSILAVGMEISFVPGEHGFSSFQVENVHWKCMCAAH